MGQVGPIFSNPNIHTVAPPFLGHSFGALLIIYIIHLAGSTMEWTMYLLSSHWMILYIQLVASKQLIMSQ